MNSIKIGFPLGTSVTSQDIFNECLNWILDSPYTSFAQENFSNLALTADFSLESSHELIEYSYASSEDLTIASLRYHKLSNPLRWITEITTRKDSRSFWIYIHASVVTTSASVNPPGIKKPVLAIRILDRFQAGSDGDFPVTHSPFTLGDTANGRLIAKGIINGETTNNLPVVYISANPSNRHMVIPARLARKLCGMAHVVVEPSRTFSHDIRPDVLSRNVHGGACGIYWPNGRGVSLFKRGSSEIKDFEDAIFTRVAQALSLSILPVKCNWEEVIQTKNRIALKKIKQEGDIATTANQLVQLYKAEIREKDEYIRHLRQDIERMGSAIKKVEQKTPIQGSLTLNTGEEDDYFQDEILSTVVMALSDHLKKNTRANSRKAHIISSIIDNNPYSELRQTQAQKIKDNLRGYREMNKKIKKALEDIGFSLSSEGRHWKITYQDDERYTYTLPKTGSDYRGGLNAAADISNIVF